MRATCVAWTLLLLIAHSAPDAQAEETQARAGAPAQPSAETDKLAADHYLAGIRALEAGRDAEAHAELLKAWELKRHWQIAANLGEVELRLGRYGEAVEHLEYFLREQEGVREEEIRRADEMLREARQRVEAEQQEREVTPRPAAATGAVVAVGAQGARGIESPDQRSRVVRSDGGETAPGSRVLRWPAITAAGVAVAGIGAGVGFTIAANGKGADVEALLSDLKERTLTTSNVCPRSDTYTSTCTRIGDLLRDKDLMSNAAIAGYAVGGVAAVGAAVLAIWPVRVGGGSTYVSVSPAPAPGGGTLFLKGAF